VFRPPTGGAAAGAAPRPPLPAVTTPEPGFVALFDGTEASFAQWQVAGLDGFSWEDGVIVTSPVDEDLGLLSYAPRPYADSVLRLQCRITAPDDNSGVFVRCRDPRQSLPEQLLATPDAATSFPNRADYASTGAWVAVDTGFEVQIDEAAAGDPSSLDPHRTGALSDVPVGTGAR
jgi:hypothetical protein